jgi:hypothetical protein
MPIGSRSSGRQDGYRISSRTALRTELADLRDGSTTCSDCGDLASGTVVALG